MYVILVNDDNTMTATVKERIVQRSKLVDTLCFLVKPSYQGIDMSSATVLMEYITPVGKKYRTEILTASNELYKEHLKYTLPVDTKITEEAGDVEIQLSFIYVDMDINGNVAQRVRKISPAHTMTVVPISAWSDIIPDSVLSPLDQRIIKVDAQIKAMEDMNRILDETKADNLKYDAATNRLQLLAGENAIGDVVQLRQGEGGYDENGVPVVDFGKTEVDDDIDVPEGSNNVVEF